VPVILLVSFDTEEGEVRQYALQQRGYETRLVTSPSQAVTSFAETTPSLSIVDVFDPLEDVIPTLKQLRTHTTAPILLLIDQRDEPHAVQALEAGADDYLIKPVGIRLFLAKAQVWMSRSGIPPPEPSVLLKVGDLQLRSAEQTVTVG
jgi:DNA-binding response OmpR family regulator